MALKRTQLEERYELRQTLGEGGMGVVYLAFDRLMQREVAVKTILDVDSETTSLFYNEWNLLANMVHPNVISIYDVGEFEHEGKKKPFFVMPLLPGVTLDRLIREGSPKLSVAGVISIIGQACRGLDAAHRQGLVHRDVKPSNIFVMPDNSVKVIDFGIAQSASSQDTGVLRGTYSYMAPEQFAGKPPTPLSDLFSLAVVTYQALTRRRPFQGTEQETIEAIQRFNPPPISNLNREVNYGISSVVAKALAKQPRHRFLNLLEFAEALEKALRNEPLEWFDSSKVKERVERAARSFEAGDYGFATEVLSELEGEGHLDQEISLLRGQVDSAMRQTRIRQLLESARRFFEATEYALALLKIQEALELDPQDPDTLLLQGQVEKKRRETKISEWISLARQHLDNQSFRQAREALDNLLQLRPNDTSALALLSEVGRQEQQLARVREEKAQVYQAARQSWEKGDVTSALSKLEILIGLDRDNPETDTGRSSTYQNFYNLVHSEHNALKNAYEEARRNLEADGFEAALAVSRLYVSKYPNHALFQALLFDIENRQRQKLSADVAEIDRRVQAERDLDRRMGILVEALKAYPNEPHFEAALRSVRDQRDLVSSIVAKARYLEERGQLTEALEQWQILKSIHSEYPELAFEIPRLLKRRDAQARESSRARLVEQIAKYLEDGDYDRAMLTAGSALGEFPEDAEILELESTVREKQERGKRALELLARAQEAVGDALDKSQSIALLREAQQTDTRNVVIRTVLVNSLLDRGRGVVDSDWQAAEELLREVLRLEPDCPAAESLAGRIARLKPKVTPTVEAPSLPTQVKAAVTEAFPVPPPTVQMERAVPAEPPPPPLARPYSVADLRQKFSAFIGAENGALWPPSPVFLRKVLYGLIGAAAVLVVLSVLTLVTRPSRPKAAATGGFRVLISSTTGAQIKLDGKPCGTSLCDPVLGPGKYHVEAQMAGFLPAAKDFEITAGSRPAEIDLALAPAPRLISISTDLPGGSVVVDGTLAGPVVDGAAEISSLLPGTHEITVQNGDLRASMILEVANGALPRISLPIQVKGMRAFVILQAGSEAWWYGSETNVKISLDDGPLKDLVVEGLEMKNLATGVHKVVFTTAQGQEEKLMFEARTAPAVYVRMSMARPGRP